MIRQAFNRASAKQEGSSGLDFLGAILRERPDLCGQTAYFPGTYAGEKSGEGEHIAEGHFQGGNGHTVFIGDEVFKGPRWSSGGSDEDYFDKEYKLLQQLEGQGLPVPRVTCVGKKTVFFGMTRLPGVQLTSEILQTFTERQRDAFVRDFASFVIGMALALPRDADGRFAVHGDLQPKNILIDPDTKKLSGFVDFGILSYSSSPPELQTYFPSVAIFNKMLRANKDLQKTFNVQPMLVTEDLTKAKKGLFRRIFEPW